VAVCPSYPAKKISGMNHFMLPGRITQRDIFTDKTARYGITAINELLKKMEEAGSVKKNLTAKIFGGGHVLESDMSSMTIPHDNVRIARVMMEIEDIPITHSDVGENYTRKLLLDVHSGKVYLKKSSRKEVMEQIAKRDTEFVERRFHNE
jgi:chemotaxis protein CheD